MSAIHGEPCYHEADPATWRYVAGLLSIPLLVLVGIPIVVETGIYASRWLWWLHGGILFGTWQLVKHDPHINAWYVGWRDADA